MKSGILSRGFSNWITCRGNNTEEYSQSVTLVCSNFKLWKESRNECNERMLTLRRADEIYEMFGQIEKGIFYSRWHFSFDSYYDPGFIQFGTLGDFNDDTHPRRQAGEATLADALPGRLTRRRCFAGESKSGQQSNVPGSAGHFPALGPGRGRRSSFYGSGSW